MIKLALLAAVAAVALIPGVVDIEQCSNPPYLELFARGQRPNWKQWGNQVEDYNPNWPTYANHSQVTSQPSPTFPMSTNTVP